MDVQHYKARLLEIQKTLGARLGRETALGREQVSDSSRDAADESVADEAASEDFSEAELDATVLQQVEAALKRIEEGTFGRCTVDGGPIETKRLDAVPWTPYCLKHQGLAEASSPMRTPTM